ncbi:MAG: hypothetical protein P1P83_05415 [Bacteroidales bacterium]|nr:hypothetical protein [Bacteroidales bacterium]MDT8374270.1 hypothetical protein [Bacteroidales bacterium]
MNRVKTIFASLILALLISGTLMAQSTPTVIGVINKADWCAVCEKYGERAMTALMAGNEDGATAFIANDLTDDKTIKTSIETLKKYELEQALAPLKGTGVAYFFNAETKALICQVSISKSDEELAEALKAAKNAVK